MRFLLSSFIYIVGLLIASYDFALLFDGNSDHFGVGCMAGTASLLAWREVWDIVARAIEHTNNAEPGAEE